MRKEKVRSVVAPKCMTGWHTVRSLTGRRISAYVLVDNLHCGVLYWAVWYIHVRRPGFPDWDAPPTKKHERETRDAWEASESMFRSTRRHILR